MKIGRYGAKRSHGLELLADAGPRPKWKAETQSVVLTVRGRPRGNTTHNYLIELSANEVAELVETALGDGRIEDRATRAFGKAMGAFLREALRVLE